MLGLAAGAVGLAACIVAVWPLVSAFTAARASTAWPAAAQPLVVVEVLSGDTVVLTSSRSGPQVQDLGTVTVRLLGIDAPNFPTSRECYAEESFAALEAMLPAGSVAWVVTDEVVQDEGGRWLGYVWSAEGDFVNDVLVSHGIVRAYDMAPNSAFWPVIAQSAEEAWRRSAGLWTACS